MTIALGEMTREAADAMLAGVRPCDVRVADDYRAPADGSSIPVSRMSHRRPPLNGRDEVAHPARGHLSAGDLRAYRCAYRQGSVPLISVQLPAVKIWLRLRLRQLFAAHCNLSDRTSNLRAEVRLLPGPPTRVALEIP